MKPFRLLSLCLLLAFVTPGVEAQHASASSRLNPRTSRSSWAPLEVLSLGDTAAVMAVSRSYYDVALILVDSAIHEQSRFSLPGQLIAMARYDSLVLAFYTPGFHGSAKPLEKNRRIRAALIDMPGEKALFDTVVFTNPGPYYAVPYVTKDEAGNFLGLLVRTTMDEGQTLAEAGRQADGFNNNFGATSALKRIELTRSGGVITHPVSSVAVGSLFLGSTMDTAGNVFITSANGHRLTIEKCARDGKRTAKSSIPFPTESGENIQACMRQDASAGGSLLVALNYEKFDKKHYTRLYRFDLATGDTARSAERALDHSFFTERREDPDTRVLSTPAHSVTQLRPLDIQASRGRIIVCSEVPGYAAIADVYDSALHLLGSCTMNKLSAARPLVAESVCLHIHDRYAYFVVYENRRFREPDRSLYSLDLNGWEGFHVIRQKTVSRNDFTIPGATWWRSQGFLKVVVQPYFTTETIFTSYFRPVAYL